jgi:DNA-binding NarL/FixJ family response regulator
VDDFIYAGYRGPAGRAAHGLSLHRPWGSRPFSERERRLVDAFHRESAWLYEPPSLIPEDLLSALPPRLRDVLRALARGLSEKQVADELRLSGHTVHDYVKSLHRHFGVNSRGELLARCLRR